MIKAEIISHEGNPGPNWLDRCRSVVTPVNVTTVVLLIVAGALFVGLTQKEQPNTANQLPATSNSQQANQSGASSLQVQPLSKMTSTADGTPDVQSATGGNTSSTASPTPNNTAAPISAPQTPGLNNSKPGSTQPQGPINSRNLTNKLQSTVQSVHDSVNRTVTGITSGLGL